MEYTPEQVEDIKSRIQKAADFLKENQLEVSAVLTKVNVGENIFADRVVPTLTDTKFKPIKSPYGGENSEQSTDSTPEKSS